MLKHGFIATFVTTAVLAVVLIVTGCHGNTPDGVYTDSTGRLTLEFKGGKAYLNLGGVADTDGTPYDVNGDKITIHYPADSMMAINWTLTINSDGSLQGGMGILKKK